MSRGQTLRLDYLQFSFGQRGRSSSATAATCDRTIFTASSCVISPMPPRSRRSLQPGPTCRLQQKDPGVCTEPDIEALFDPARAVDLYYDVVRSKTEWSGRDFSIKTLAEPRVCGASSIASRAASQLLAVQPGRPGGRKRYLGQRAAIRNSAPRAPNLNLSSSYLDAWIVRQKPLHS
jgi:hypothetical protein